MFLKLPAVDEWCNIYLVQALRVVRAEPNEAEHYVDVLTVGSNNEGLTILYRKVFPTETDARAAAEELGKFVHVWTSSDELAPGSSVEGEDDFDIPDDATIQ